MVKNSAVGIVAQAPLMPKYLVRMSKAGITISPALDMEIQKEAPARSIEERIEQLTILAPMKANALK